MNPHIEPLRKNLEVLDKSMRLAKTAEWEHFIEKLKERYAIHASAKPTSYEDAMGRWYAMEEIKQIFVLMRAELGERDAVMREIHTLEAEVNEYRDLDAQW